MTDAASATTFPDASVAATTARPLRPLPANYLLLADLLHMLLAALILNLFLFVGTEVPLLFQLVITGLIMVVMVRGGGWLALGAMQASMFFYETRVDMALLDLSTIVYAVLCLALVAYATGFRTIRRWLRDWLGRWLQELIVAPPYSANRSVLSELDARRDRLEEWLWLRQQSWLMLVRGGRLSLIVVIASIAFLKLPVTRPAIRMWWDRTVAMDLVLWPGPNIFTIAVVCLVALSIGAWRRLNVHQARLYLKSLYVREHYRELRSVLVRGKFLTQPLRESKAPVKVAAVKTPPMVTAIKSPPVVVPVKSVSVPSSPGKPAK